MAAPVFFDSPEAFRTWLAAHAHTAAEIVVGLHKLGTGRSSMTWPASVDEALCVGWVDGVRKRIDQHAYQIRFTPRKPSSTWSAINIERVRVLSEAGRMTPAGLAAFAHRREVASRTYSYEQAGPVALAPADEALFRKNRRAWAFFEAQPPGYRKQMIWRVVSAKQQGTRDRRLGALIDASAEGRRMQ